LSDLRRLGPRQLAAGLALVALAVVWPLVSQRLVDPVGVRALATVLLGLSAVSLAAMRSAVPRELALERIDSIALIALVAAAALTGERLFLLLVPAWIQFAVFRLFRRSLRDGASVFERVARALEPHAPEFIAPYCRKATALWGWVFLANAVAIAALALLAPLPYWRAFTSWIVWLVIAALSAGDFVVRKVYFRSYHDRAIDRVLARLFPPEASEMGRRSNEYRRARRRALGRAP
jgi:uncharacterized membrane protein